MDRTQRYNRSPKKIIYANPGSVRSPRQSAAAAALNLDKYLIGGSKRSNSMDSDQTAESDISDWESGRYPGHSIALPPGMQGADTSEESDDYPELLYHGEKRKYPAMFDTMIDTPIRDNHEYPHKKEYEESGHHTGFHGNYPHMSSVSADGALDTSLYTLHESQGSVTDSSRSYDSNSEGTISNTSSPVHNPVYGRYQKITGDSQNISPQISRFHESQDIIETLMLHRLPGENLGMILGIEGGKDGIGTVLAVSVKSVTLGGAAYRATGSSKGVCVGDEIVEVNGTQLRTLTHDECITAFKEMPLQVLLTVKRGAKDLPAVEISPVPMEHQIDRVKESQEYENSGRSDGSDSDEEDLGGFAMYQVEVPKEPEENLGLSIVPSYGSTKEFYQLKRILPSGAAARSGQLRVGDRLISCNGKNLQGLTQNHCLNILKSASAHGDVILEVLRPIDDGAPMEISVTLNNNKTLSSIPGYDASQFSVKSQSYDRHVDVIVTSESEDYLTVSEDESSRNGHLINQSETKASQVFSDSGVRLPFQKPFTPIEEVDTTEAETEPEADSPVGRDYDSDRVLSPNTDVVDLNTINTSPYHIPHKTEGSVHISSPVLYAVDASSPRQRVPSPDSEPLSYPEEGSSEEEYQLEGAVLQGMEVALPPPVEFSDNPTESQPESVFLQNGSAADPHLLPYTNIDDIIPSSDSERTPTHHNQSAETGGPWQERISSKQIMEVEAGIEMQGEGHDMESGHGGTTLACSTEVTMSNDLIHLENSEPYGKYHVQNSPRVPDAFADPMEEVLIVEQQGDGNITVTQFDSNNISEPVVMENHVTMDTGSEAMLKNALDMEYDKLPESSKFEARMTLGDNTEAEEPNLGDQVVAQMLAQEMIDNEGTGSYQESDEEPDEFPEADQPLDEPDQVPDDLPSVSSNIVTIQVGNSGPSSKADEVVTATEGLNVKLVPSVSSKPTPKPRVTEHKPSPAPTQEIPQLSPRVTVSVSSPRQEGAEEHIIVPQKLDRKVQIPVRMDGEPKADTDSDVIKPVRVERKLNAKVHEVFSEEVRPPAESVVVETKPVITVTTAKQQKPAVLPKASPRNAKEESISQQVAPSVECELGSPDVEQHVVSDSFPTQHGAEEQIIVPQKLDRKVQIPVRMNGEPKTDQKDDTDSNVIKPVRVERKLNAKVHEVFSEEVRPPTESVVVETKPVITVNTAKQQSPRSPKEELISQQLMPSVECDLGSPVEEQQVVAMEVKRDQNKSIINVFKAVSAMKDGAKDTDNGGVKKPGSTLIDVKQKEVPAEKSTLASSEPAVCMEKEEGGAKEHKTVVNVQADQSSDIKTPDISMKTSITVEKPSFKPTETQITKNEPEGRQLQPSKVSPVPAPKPRVKDTALATTTTTVPNDVSKPKSSSEGITVSVPKTETPVPMSKPNIAMKTQIKPFSTIKPLSFNPKSLPLSRPTQYKASVTTAGGIRPGTSLSSSLGRSSILNPAKAEHPIKRMETMPFEVSILKGILGIGIKTKMTPEGFVEVTEILPSGPVGREGNIKVGDYLLSINKTELTGLPDSKVQQILRLLPRGLSKIVASAVTPDSADINKNIPEKKPLSPRQSLPTAATKQPAITTSPKPTIVTSPRQSTSPRQPTTSPRQPVTVITASPVKPESPVPSPRQQEQPLISPRKQELTQMSPRQQEKPQISPRYQPQISPRQQDQHHVSPRQQEQSYVSPRQPPPVAPKPRKSLVEAAEGRVAKVNDNLSSQQVEPRPSESHDETGPIDTEIFVSITGPKDFSVSSPVQMAPQKSSTNVLPGSVSYDSVVPQSETVVSANLGPVSGKLDVVGTVAPSSETELALDTKDVTVEPENVVASEKSKDTDSSSSADSYDEDFEAEAAEKSNETGAVNGENEEILSSETKPETSEFTFKASAIINDLKEEIDNVAASPRQRTTSTGSNTSYTEFTECSVEEEDIPEEIEEPVQSQTVTQQFSELPVEQIHTFETEEEPACIEESVQISIGVSENEPPSDLQQCPEDSQESEETSVICEVPRLDLASITGTETDNSNESPTEKDNEESSESERATFSPTDENSAPQPDMAVLRDLAENIVSQVFENVKEMGLGKQDSEQEDREDGAAGLETSVENVGIEASVDLSGDQTVNDTTVVESDAPALPDDAPPPLPNSPVPGVDDEAVADQPAVAVSDSFQFSPAPEECVAPEECIAPETFEISHSSPLHADVQVTASVPDGDLDTPGNHGDQSVVNDYSSITQVEEDREGSSPVVVMETDSECVQEEKDSVFVDSSGDQRISAVISMYSDIEKSKDDLGMKVAVSEDKSAKTELVDSNPEQNHNDTEVSAETSQPGKDGFVNKAEDSAQEPEPPGQMNGHPVSPKSDSSVESSPTRHKGSMRLSDDIERMIRVASLSDVPQEGEGEVITVKMMKGVTGVGFVIQGGRASPKGDLPITIKKIFKGGPADQSGQLMVKDEILAVNDEDITGMKHSEAWHHLKFLSSGEISLTIKRYQAKADEEIE